MACNATVVTRAATLSAATFLFDQCENVSVSTFPSNLGGAGCLDHSKNLGLGSTPGSLGFRNIRPILGGWYLGIWEILSRRPLTTIELLSIRLRSREVDGSVVQVFLKHIGSGLRFFHIPDGQECVIKFVFKKAKGKSIIFISGATSKKIAFQHREGQVVFILSGVGEFHGSSTKINRQFRQVLAGILLWSTILDLLFDGFKTFNGLNLDLVHQHQPYHMKTICLFQLLRDDFRKSRRE